MDASDGQRLGVMRDYYAKNQAFPSMQRIAKVVGYRSTSAVSAFVDRLSQTGHLTRTEGGRVAPGPHFFERALVTEKVPAGVPVGREDLGNTPTLIDQMLVRHPSRAFILRIEGDSMVEAGLLDGDYVVVERDTLPQVGDIVVAHVDGRYTVKYLAGTASRHYLKAANPQFRDIVAKDRLEIVGLVVGAFRKIH